MTADAVAPATEAGRALSALEGWDWAGLTNEDVNERILAIETEAARLALTPTVAGTVFHRWRNETLAEAAAAGHERVRVLEEALRRLLSATGTVPYHRPRDAEGPHREYTCDVCIAMSAARAAIEPDAGEGAGRG